MFPLSCVPVRAHTGREMSAHKKTWSTHTFFFKNGVLPIFPTFRSKYKGVRSAGKMLHKGNFV